MTLVLSPKLNSRLGRRRNQFPVGSSPGSSQCRDVQFGQRIPSAVHSGLALFGTHLLNWFLGEMRFMLLLVLVLLSADRHHYSTVALSGPPATQLALPILAAHGSRRQIGSPRVDLQHTHSPPSTSRYLASSVINQSIFIIKMAARCQQVLSGQELRRVAHHLGQIVRHVPGRIARRRNRLWSSGTGQFVQSAVPAGVLRWQNLPKMEVDGRLEEQNLRSYQRSRMETWNTVDWKHR